MKPQPDLAMLIARVPLGIVFLIAGWNKLKGGLAGFVSQASGAIPSYMPQAIGKAYLYAVPFAELIVGICLIVGLFTRVVGVITALMLLSFMMAVTGFTDRGGLHFSVIYMSLALAIALIGAGRYSVDAKIRKRA